MEWLNKYYPKSIKELIGNKKGISDIIYWITNFGKDKANMILIGNHGIGKSTVINVILREMDYEIKKINHDSNVSIICKTIQRHKDISMLVNKNTKKVAILIDNFELIISKIDRTSILELLKYNNIKHLFPIILISNNQHNKFLTEIKKISYEIKLWPPYSSEINELIKYINNKEHIKMTEEVIDNISEFVDGNIRQVILTLYQIKDIYNELITKKIWEKITDNLCETTNTDFDLFKSADNLIHNYRGIDECLKLYRLDKVLLPLMIQQNYIKCISDINSLCEITELLSEGDIIEGIIYNNQNWELNDIHGILTCVIPSYIMSDTSNKRVKLDFPSDLNKTSTKKTNKKNIKTNDMDIDDYINMSSLLNKLSSKYNKQEFVKIVKNYDLDNIESIMRLSINETYYKKYKK